MKQSSSWEAKRFSTTQEITRILWKPKVHHRIYKCAPPVPILSKQQSSSCTPTHFLKIHPHIILPSTPGSSRYSLSLRFPHQNPVHTSPLPHMCYMPRQYHSFKIYPFRFQRRHVQEQCYISSWMIGTVSLHYQAFFQILTHQAQPASYMADENYTHG